MKRYHYLILPLSTVVLFFLAACSSVSDENSTNSASIERIKSGPERAHEVLESCTSFITGLKAFSFNVHALRSEMMPDGLRLQFEQQTRINVRRPEDIHASTSGDLDKTEFFLHQGQATLYDPEKRLFTVYPAPGDIDKGLETLRQKHGFSIPLAELIFNNLDDIIKNDIKKTHYIGMSKVSRQLSHHLLLEGENLSWQIWIAAAENPWPLKVVITYSKEEGIPEYTAMLSDWKEFSNLPDKTFKFIPPEGALKLSGGRHAE